MTIQALEPQLKEPFPNIPEFWTDPITGLKVPKRFQENIEWRKKLLHKADKDHGFRRELMTACSLSKLFWINSMVWTFKQWDIDEKGHRVDAKFTHVPFITWEIQDEAVNKLEKYIRNGRSVGLDKSRDMGATWIILTVCDHYFLFDEDRQILLLSRTENYVDQSGNPKALFWKLDYLHEWLPEWMQPPGILKSGKNRTKMHVYNEFTRSTIDGESTTAHAARGDRRFIIMMDEFAAVENGAAMRTATNDAALCRIVNSTPIAGSEYSIWMNDGTIDVIKLPWWEHPEKGRDRYVRQDPVTQKWEIRSPWYDLECQTRSPQEIASELDMNHMGAGSLFFESTILEQHKALYCKPSRIRMNVDFQKNISNDMIPRLLQSRSIESVKTKRVGTVEKPLHIWTNLVLGRPDQSFNYIFGIDISKGQGASNSVVSIYCVELQMKIAEWVNASVPPYEFARIVAALAIWCGGANPRRLPFVIWESNGDPGIDFGRVFIQQLKYPFYFIDETTGKVTNKKTRKYGWHSSQDKKAELLGVYRQVFAHGGYINPSEEAITEAQTYIYYEGGGIGPAYLREEGKNARATHGDRVIADALSLYGAKNASKPRKTKPSAPYRSVAYRKEQYLKKKNSRKIQNKKWRKHYQLVGS